MTIWGGMRVTGGYGKEDIRSSAPPDINLKIIIYKTKEIEFSKLTCCARNGETFSFPYFLSSESENFFVVLIIHVVPKPTFPR